jgi:hypothetical protein
MPTVKTVTLRNPALAHYGKWVTAFVNAEGSNLQQ